MEDVGTNIDARNYLLIYQGFLQFVRLLVGFLDGKFLDLSQFARECFIESLLGGGRSDRGLRLRSHQGRRHVLAETGLAHQSRPQQLLDVGVVHVHLTGVDPLQIEIIREMKSNTRTVTAFTWSAWICCSC